MGEPTLGVIGGSGLYELDGLADVERRRVATPFGEPSDELVIGRREVCVRRVHLEPHSTGAVCAEYLRRAAERAR